MSNVTYVFISLSPLSGCMSPTVCLFDLSALLCNPELRPDNITTPGARGQKRCASRAVEKPVPRRPRERSRVLSTAAPIWATTAGRRAKLEHDYVVLGQALDSPCQPTGQNGRVNSKTIPTWSPSDPPHLVHVPIRHSCPTAVASPCVPQQIPREGRQQSIWLQCGRRHQCFPDLVSKCAS